MKIAFQRYPLDIVLFIILSIILLLIVLFNIDGVIRIILGIPFLFFIPGYLLIFCFFPMSTEYKGIKGIERIGLSIGFSIAIVSILGFALNYTPMGIRLETILLSLFFVAVSLGFVALYRWKTTDPDHRFIISYESPQLKSHRGIEHFLTIVIIFSIVLAGASLVYIISVPRSGEPFTDFYLQSSNGNDTDYPQDINAGEDTTVVLGLINHENKVMNYTIEIWLIDETIVFNESTQKNDTVYHHAWLMDELVVPLNHTDITNEKSQLKNWEYNYTFTINRMGYHKLVFLLFTIPSEGFDPRLDYKDTIGLRLQNAYRELHLWLYVG
jgi:uncharacterized membrane protein